MSISQALRRTLRLSLIVGIFGLATTVSAACRTETTDVDEGAPAPGMESGATADVQAPEGSEDAEGPAEGMFTASPATSAPPESAVDVPTAEAAQQATEQARSEIPPMVGSFGVPGSEPGQMTLPFDVALDGEGHVFVSDTTGITKYTTGGQYVLRLADGEIPMAEGIVVGPDGLVYVTGYGALIHVCDPDGPLLRTIGEAGEAPGQLRKPTDITIDNDGNLLVADAGNRRLERFSRDGRHLQTIGEPGTMSGQFTAPRNVSVDAEGRIYVGQGDDFLVHRFSPDGRYIDAFGKSTLDENMFRTAGVAVDEDGIAYVARSLTHKIQAFDITEETPQLRWEMGGMPGYSSEQFNAPGGMEVRDDQLWIADTRNNRVVTLQLR